MPQPALTLDQALAITFTAGHAWSPGGRLIGFIHDDGGRFSLRVASPDTEDATQISEGDVPVTAFAWAPDGAIGYVQDGRLLLARAQGGSSGPNVRWASAEAYAGPDPVAALAWAFRGSLLAFHAGGKVWTLDLRGPSLRALALPWPVRALGHEPPLAWSPDARMLAVTIRDGAQWDLAVVTESGRVLWRTHTEELEGPAVWLRPGRLLFARTSVPYTAREWHVLDVPADGRPAQVRRLHRAEEPDGLGADFAPQPHPDGRRAVLVLRHEGWWHLYVLDTETGTLRALTGGEAEDVGHAVDRPRISPDGREVIFSANRVNLGQRHLFSADLTTGELRQVTGASGTSVEPEWSPWGDRIAFKHSTIHHAPEIWIVDRGGEEMRRVVGAMPPGVDPGRFPLPKAATIRGAHDWEIPGYLLTPEPLEPGRRYPALVYVHGGGMRQMREGFPPLEAYAFHYAVSLWLTGLGVVSYLVNYRGGIGYGRAFEQGNSGGLGVLECQDCVRAGEYLKSLPFVDPERVGIWGLSYGGWLTLASLCRSPETFALGVNFAGLWDFGRWMAWAKEAYRPPYDYFLGRARGTRAESPDVWRNASPRHLIERMRAPLINFHGTADAAVPFEQLDLIVEDCVRHGKRFETHYYPGETHLFTHRATWRDALRKFEAALRTYLGVTE
ncbi:MAG TPA: prolyl oligopeptidase family serine peptidase [bacterium]|nr:prolyl oligopeptidase family serine peptidase [bacterium]